MDTTVARAKEEWMEPLQPAVRQGVVQLKDFITKLVDIEEKEGKDLPTYHAQSLCASLALDPAYCPAHLSSHVTVLLFCNPGLAANSVPRITLNLRLLWPPSLKG